MLFADNDSIYCESIIPLKWPYIIPLADISPTTVNSEFGESVLIPTLPNPPYDEFLISRTGT